MTAPHDEAVEVMVQAFTPMCAGFGHGNIPAGVARDFAAQGAAALTAAGFTIERADTITDLRAQVAMLREAVKPFATQTHRYDDDEAENNYIWCKDHQGVFLEAYRVRDLRRARDAYDATEPKGAK